MVMTEISVIIPVYNEEKRLQNSLFCISEYIGKRYTQYEIIVVDDGSSDATKQIVEKLTNQIPNLKIISNSKNRGKGYSVKRGILASKGDITLFSDADLSTPIDELEKLKNAIEEGYDIAIGSRASRHSIISKRQSILREYMGKTFNFFVRLMLMRGIKDTQCGFKLFKRKVAFDLFSREKIDGFAFDVEILYIAKKLGYGIKTVPVKWSNSSDTSVRLFTSSLNMFFDLIKIKRLHCNT